MEFQKIIQYVWAIEMLNVRKFIVKKLMITVIKKSLKLFIEIDGYVRNDFVKLKINESKLFSVITNSKKLSTERR